MADFTEKYKKGGLVLEWAHIPTLGSADPAESSVQFKAFITTFNESYSSDWNQEHVYGRMDPIESFRATRRTISLAWTVIAHGAEEAVENLQNVSKLLKFLYPTYAIQNKSFNESGFGVISASPLLRLKFMNLIQSTAAKGVSLAASTLNSHKDDTAQSYGSVITGGLAGRVDGFNVTHELDDGLFMHEGINAKAVSSGMAVPKRISLSCNFYPIHEHGMGWHADGEAKAFFSPEWPYGHSSGVSPTQAPMGDAPPVDQTSLAEVPDEDSTGNTLD
jgi:hypothetical protein